VVCYLESNAGAALGTPLCLGLNPFPFSPKAMDVSCNSKAAALYEPHIYQSNAEEKKS
jgi:hypothetical protein